MNLSQLINRVRSTVRDFNGSIYREQDVIDYLNEGIDRLKSIPVLATMSYPTLKTDEIMLLPKQYQYLISLYSASRCFFQDGQAYNAGTMMNEFETKMNELADKIGSGEITIVDANGIPITADSYYVEDYIKDIYFETTSDDTENLEDYIKFYE